MRALLLILAAATANAAPNPGKAGVGEGGRGVERCGCRSVLGEYLRRVDRQADTGVPRVFRFHWWGEGRFDDLPAPDAPFHLSVSFPWPGDETKEIAKEITDGGLKELVRFQNLRSLDVFGTTITDTGAKEIAKLKNLGELDLSCTKVTAVGLKALAKLPSITRLTLSQMDVTEDILKEVAEFENLTRFHLSFNKSEVTIAGMKQIAKLGKLEVLDFFDVDVADAAAKELGRLKNLKDLDFLNTNVTKAGAEELRKLLPKCDISARTVDLTTPSPLLPPPPIPMS